MWFEIWAARTMLCVFSQLYPKWQISAGPYGPIFCNIYGKPGTSFTKYTNDYYTPYICM